MKRLLLFLVSTLWCCLASGEPTHADQLADTIHSSLATMWRQEGQSPSVEALQKMERTTQQAVTCFHTRAANYDGVDVQLFKSLITQYQSIFATESDWEDKVATAIDIKFGQGASSRRRECQKDVPNSQNCAVARSFQAVGVYLYAELLSCAMKAVEAQRPWQ